MTIRLKAFVFLLFLFCGATLFAQNKKHKDNWFLISDTSKDECGYVNQKGDTVIPIGKYHFCFTDTFRTYAIVLKQGVGFVGIDKQELVLYKVFPYDNGPDYESDGLFRIVQNDKMGYADAKTGKVVIKPQFGCAYPFEKGIAQVSLNCTTHSDDGEHHYWTSDNWFYIDKKGRKVNRQKHSGHIQK